MESFSIASILCMLFNVVAGIGLPIAMVVFIKKKFEMRIGPLFIGACAYLGVNIFLQGIIDAVVTLIQPLAAFFEANATPRIVIMALLHGLTHMGGYYLMIHIFMKDFKRKEASLLFGVGIRVIDSVIAYGISNGLMLLMLASTINSQGIDAYVAVYGNDVSAAEEARATLVNMIEMPLIEIIGVGIICVCLLFMTTAVAVLIFQAAKRPGKMYLLPTAGAICVLNCLFMEMYSAGVIESLGVCDLLLALLAIVSCVIAYFVFKNDTDEERGKADIVVTAKQNAPEQMSMREKLAKINKSSTPGEEE